MKEDITPELTSGKPKQKHYYSRKGAKGVAVNTSLVLWCISLIIAVFSFRRRMHAPNSRILCLKHRFLPLAALSLFGGAITFAALPKTEVYVSGRSGLSFIFEMSHFHRQLLERTMLAEDNAYFPNADVNEVTSIVDNYLKENKKKNPYTNEPIALEDSPGNYTVFKDERGIILRDYSENGFPSDFALTAKPDKR
jgi:hypothetical protein